MVMILACGLCALAVPILLVALVVQKLRKRPVKRQLIALPVALVACIALGWGSDVVADIERTRAAELYEIHRVENLQTTLDFAVEDGTEPLEVTEYETSTTGSVWVYDSEHLSLLLGETEAPTPEACKQEIRERDRIPEKFKVYFDRQLSPSCTDDEAQAAADALATRLFNGTPDDWPARRERVYEYLEIWRGDQAAEAA